MPVYAHHTILESLPDLFCAETLWQAPGFALFSRRPLLRDLLERSPREQRGRTATRCFAHVILSLPQEDIDDDYHLARGARARELEQALAALHQRDFADLLGGDTVRYRVQGCDSLPPGAVSVRFGHAVYLPAQGEKIAFSASISRDGAAWKPVCPVYAGQRLALLGADAILPCAPAEPSLSGAPQPDWPLGRDGAILLLNEGPGAQPVVQVRPRDAYECRFDAALGCYTVRSRQGAAQGQLLLRISAPAAARPAQHDAPGIPPSERASANAGGAMPNLPHPPHAADAAQPPQAPIHQPAIAAAGHAVWQPRPGAAHPEPRAASREMAAQPSTTRAQPVQAHRTDASWDATALPLPPRRMASEPTDATYVPVARQRVILAALALPRLSRYRATGAERLDIPLGTDDSFTLTIDADDGLHTLDTGGRHAVAAPATLPQAGGRAIELLPAPAAMADRYCALLPLPQPASVQLPLAGRHRFGRQAPALAPLRLLDSPRLLHGGGAPSSADRIGLSREAFSFEMSPRGVHITRLAASQALYHLDAQLQFVAAIGAAAEEAPYLLPRGHHVAAGHYVLRFDA
ncbi:hypothetical protein GCM10027277_01190 [Pseudoduganella ginsengisoli]|uniref:Uncharacterized protein n=1 Tax=Pseudoduganella ginsengisoli TaxID=1462440 RepID=A0A6L6QAH0_9BURK|nr:hypothetical protein [Pseudoduganella ginsengisoli]MTW06232.1 hypothetical protein [Pseudoduganella ginsengisoli]